MTECEAVQSQVPCQNWQTGLDSLSTTLWNPERSEAFNQFCHLYLESIKGHRFEDDGQF